MRTKSEKGCFLAKIEKEIQHRETLRSIVDNVLPEFIKKWDGKVFNKRFVNEFNIELKKVSNWVSARAEQKTFDQYSNMAGRPCCEMVISYQNEAYNYTDKEELYVRFALTYDTNYNARIAADDYGKESLFKAWQNNFDKETECEREILSKYDEYMDIANKMEAAVKAYNELPYRFRENIDKYYLRIY